MITPLDIQHLHRCIELAADALNQGDQPFGSILVSEMGEVLFEDHNHIGGSDQTQHPEFNIARWAGQNLPQEERANTTVYTSGEHCSMCAAAHGKVGLGRIVYAASSQQYSQWLKEFGVIQESNVISRPIQEVIKNTLVEGPVPELADDIKNLHRLYFEQQKLEK